jgi:PilZ domain
MLTAQKEKRLFSRVSCLVDLKAISIGGKVPVMHSVEASDLSLSGLGVRFDPTDARFSVGEKSLVTIFGLPPVRAKVCWVGPKRAGFQFFDTLQNVADSWVGEVLAAQGARMGQLLQADAVGFEGIQVDL